MSLIQIWQQRRYVNTPDASSSWTASTLPGLSDNLKTYTADIELLRIRTNDADNVVNKTTLNI